MTMTDKLMQELHQEIDNLALNPMQHGIYDEQDLVDFCIAYVIANLDSIAEAWKEIEGECNEQ